MQEHENFMRWDKPGVALITGASSGIGSEFARQLAGQGFNLVLVARRQEMLEKIGKELQDKHGINVEILAADLGSLTEADRVASRIRELDNLDILINNAGFGLPGGFVDCDYERMLQMMQVHDTTPVILTRAAIPGMVQRSRGGIIFTSSVSGLIPAPGMYSPTKAFLIMLAECLNLELDGTGVRIQALCPGFTHTEFHDKEFKDFKQNIPNFMWGTMNNVVKESLTGLRKKKTIVVPGRLNRFIWKCIPMTIKKRVTKKHKK